MSNDRIIAFSIIFGSQFNTLSQIARLLTALYLAYIGKNNDLLPMPLRDFCKFMSLIYYAIVVIVAIINTLDYLHV